MKQVIMMGDSRLKEVTARKLFNLVYKPLEPQISFNAKDKLYEILYIGTYRYAKVIELLAQKEPK